MLGIFTFRFALILMYFRFALLSVESLIVLILHISCGQPWLNFQVNVSKEIDNDMIYKTYYLSSTELLIIFFTLIGILVTVLLIDRLGRRAAMAVEFLLLTVAVSFYIHSYYSIC